MPCGPRPGSMLLAAALLVMLPWEAGAKVALRPTRVQSRTCEMPNVFYSSAPRVSELPCCATAIGLCAGGTACPPSGTCPDGKACAAAPPPAPTNLVVMAADD